VLRVLCFRSYGDCGTYDSFSNIQMEVDAALFARALEANGAVVVKKFLMDARVIPEQCVRLSSSSSFSLHLGYGP